MKKTIAVCAFIGCCLIGQGAARAAESYNIGHNSYTYLESPTSDADTVRSYLINNGDNTLTRVEYYDGELIAEDYDSEFNLLGGHELETELELFGGFYSGEEYNFFVFGQKNTEENDDTEVFRVVRYTKDWQRVDSAGLCGANTAEPFASGSLRMTECGTRTELITEHAAEDAAEVSAPQLVKINDDSFLLLWTETGGLNYVFLNGEGGRRCRRYTHQTAFCRL